ncbi:ras-related GTP-binding protein D [Echinops telfairi]|uniref:Ras-related GTP-binding protein D n=1 Tax=Echinops telfairi TaxID=9371 RepID=A0AC55DET0_ECHTE|nr:ras-related GTP-binding protein D [Echinops telfairi]
MTPPRLLPCNLAGRRKYLHLGAVGSALSSPPKRDSMSERKCQALPTSLLAFCSFLSFYRPFALFLRDVHDASPQLLCSLATSALCDPPSLEMVSKFSASPSFLFVVSPVLDFSDPFSTEVKPRILLMGLRRSGKSSIQKVVFHKMSPNETLFLESTNKICREDVSHSSFVSFQIWDFPGQIDFFDPTFDYEMIFRGTGALIFVIDSQDDYMEALARLHLTVTRAYKVNTDINFEVFIHKVDGLSDDHKIETQRDIHQRANDDLADAGLEKIHLSFYLTSIYDHSIFEAFSKVVQKLIPQLPTLENLLNIFISNSGIEKAFLFDVVSKIYIATDSTPVDMQTYELCCDMIDVVVDISCIYGKDH